VLQELDAGGLAIPNAEIIVLQELDPGDLVISNAEIIVLQELDAGEKSSCYKSWMLENW
jgi:hypothetical protein